MAILNIIENGNELLRQKSQKITEFNSELFKLLDDMKDTLKHAKGAGLAGVQVAVNKRLFVVDVEEGYFEFINPEILGMSGSQYGMEGCLSVPGKWGDVKRPRKITVKAQDRNGKHFKVVARDFFAKAISHEYDHLEGILYLDKANNVTVDIVREKNKD